MSGTTEKRILSLEEHRKILRMITPGRRLMESLSALCVNKLDEQLEESDYIAEELIRLSNSTMIGRIADYTVRQWLNREERKVEPLDYQISVRSKRTNNYRMSSRLLKTLLARLMREKIRINPGVIQHLREHEELERVKRKEQEKGFLLSCDDDCLFPDCPFPVDVKK